MSEQRNVALPGSFRQPPPAARRVGPADPQAPVQVTLVLRRAPGADPTAPTTREQTAERLGADPADIALVEEFAAGAGLRVLAVDRAARSVRLGGTVAQMDAAFGVELADFEVDGRTFRGREGEVTVPAALADVVVAVLGLDERPQAQAHVRFAPSAAAKGYPPQEVARRYRFPTDADGTGETVAIIELGGGYTTTDLGAYFTEQGLRIPQIVTVGVDGASNSPGDPADAEVALDIEVIGAVAQGARQVVYFGPNTTDGFYDVIAAAVHDTQRTPSVVSISWGGAESTWTTAAMDAYDALFADAGALGVTVFAAAGDDGSDDRVGDGADHVDFPASSPHVLGCGGTTLTDTSETVWNELASGHGATGGGVSRHFGLPDYQARAGVPANPDGRPGRGVPDVAGDADPATGYQVRVGGQDQVIGGTSAVAPLWAALTAIANQRNPSAAGAAHAVLYAAPAAFTDIVQGDNGSYRAGPGWDACTGLGSPVGTAVADALHR